VIETDNLEHYTMIFYPDDVDESDIGDEADTEDEEDGDGDVIMKVINAVAAGGA